MIQEYFKNINETNLPNYNWSIDYYVESGDNCGSVYYEGGSTPSSYDDKVRRPNYMIMLSSINWEQVEIDIQSIFKTFHMTQNRTFTDSRGKTFEIISIQAQGEPLRLGVENNRMEYTINFNTLVREV